VGSVVFSISAVIFDPVGRAVNGSRDLNRATEQEKTLAIALIALAGPIFAGLFALWPGTLSNLNHTGVRWANILVILVLVALAASMTLGGRGFAYGPKRADWGDRFNLQAVFGAAEIFLILVLGVVIFMTNEPSPNEKFAAKQTELETHFKDLGDKVDKNQAELAAKINDLSTKVSAVSNDLSDLKNRLDGVQKKLGDLDRSSADHSNKLHEIDDSIKSLSSRVDQLEKNASQSKP
jgi:methyl-accepting chemotaxis protein